MFFGEFDLLIGALVHKVPGAAVGVHVLHGALLEFRLIESLTGSEDALEDTSGLEIAQFGGDFGATLGGAGVL
jgi:hypothetical protein